MGAPPSPRGRRRARRASARCSAAPPARPPGSAPAPRPPRAARPPPPAPRAAPSLGRRCIRLPLCRGSVCRPAAPAAAGCDAGPHTTAGPVTAHIPAAGRGQVPARRPGTDVSLPAAGASRCPSLAVAGAAARACSALTRSASTSSCARPSACASAYVPTAAATCWPTSARPSCTSCARSRGAWAPAARAARARPARPARLPARLRQSPARRAADRRPGTGRVAGMRAGSALRLLHGAALLGQHAVYIVRQCTLASLLGLEKKPGRVQGGAHRWGSRAWK